MVPYARKKNGAMRLCVDFKSVNSLTKLDSFRLPNLNDTVSQLGGNAYFSSLDLMSGYYQLPLNRKSREITAFSTGEQLYQYIRLHFGVTNGPACFTRLMSVVLSGVPMDQTLVYLDDIMVIGRTFEEHLENLRTVLSRLREHQLKLNIEKCEFFKTKADYLGHEVSREGISPLKKNLDAIIDFPPPRTVRQLKRFNGMMIYYKIFMNNSANIMKPLYSTTATKTLKWTDEHQKAFELAK